MEKLGHDLLSFHFSFSFKQKSFLSLKGPVFRQRGNEELTSQIFADSDLKN